MNFSQDIKRPKMEFDRFGFSSIKPSSSKVEQFHIGNQPSMEQVRSSNPIISNPYSTNNPNAPTTNNFENFSSNNQNAPTTSNFDNSPLNNSFLIYGPTFDYRKICLSYVQLTANQIASRHTMNKKLPQFYGDPIKWQMFDSAFIHSTITCGLSNSENLSRLSESLKGDAENAVKCRLLHPDSVPGVMETLRLMFGRPELVINALLDEITNTKAPKSDDLGSLVQFAIAVQNLCSTIQFYKSIEHLRNPTLMKALTDKLPSQIQLNWAFYKQRAGDVNVSTLGDWLYELATIASDVVTIDVSANKKARKEGENLKNNKQANYINVQNESKPKSSGVSSKNLKKCPACNKDICKVLAFCEKFKNMSRQERWKLIKSNNLCGCCLGTHRYFNCKQKTPCGIAGCSYFHHVLLHNESKTENPEKQTLQGNDRLKKDCNSMKVIGSKFPELFRIVPVKLFVNGKSMRIFVYLDDGSNLTTLNKALAHKIGLCGSKESLCVKWSFGDTQVEVDSNRVTVQISGVFDGAEIFTLVDVRTVDKLQLPSQSITKSWLSQYSYLKDIPITPYMNAVPQMIIGLNYSKLMVSFDTIEGNWNQPIACRTRLGWTIQGPNDRNISLVASNKFSLNMCECQLSDNNLHHLVKGFFSHESFGVTISDRIIESKEMMRARNILESSTVKNGNHYEAALLWRKTDVTLPHSFDMAMRRLECVESKMKKNPILAERMRIYIKEIMNKGYIRKLNQYEQRNHGSRTWYLPVFPVFNPKKPEKLRLVWDGAAKVKGVSLNSELLAGPDQLVPLPDILRRFREACIGLSTDIIEMFHRVQVNKDDQDSQRFLWRDGDDKKEPEVFVLQVLPFGLTCSPAIAQFVKNKNALEFRQEFPIAVEAITKNHYVDDMIERAHDVESAVKLIKDVQFIHGHANFNLRNLVSNNQQVLEKINGSTEFSDKILAEKLDFNVERILGMYWNTKTDTFTYSLQFVKFNEMTKESPTKREVLRIVMSVFDPLGFLAHLLVHAKILLQEIWRNDIGWDTSLPDLLKQKWFKWLQHLQQVEQLHIPRLYSPRMSPNQPTYIQLHVFVDASAQAYATSAYFRIEDELGVDSQIVGAKSRVASNKPISIPRLELQGAVLGSRFAESIIKSHYNLNIEKVVFWCDSKTVLFWLDSEPRRYSQFVAFRLGEILDSTINAQWRWIPSEFNVADMATKTKNLPELHSSSVWFVGPEFLRHRNPEFSFELDESNFTTDEEVRPLYLLSHLAVPVQKFIEYERFSNWQRLLRATTYVLRFIQNSKLHHQNRNFGIFSSDELLAGENWLFRQVQHDCFSEEILIVRWNLTAPLDKQRDFDKASIIRTCSPFLDEFGVLRVMGRLDNAHSISESAKRPIILARNHHVTHLIVDWYHRKYCHRHHQTVLNEIKQKFWIPKLRMVLNGIRNSCQKCKNSAASSRIPEMGAIPKERLAVFTRPFTFSGVDYFGPIKVIVNRGTQKRWGVLFTCMTTRAIHLEIAHSMDTSSCIMSIRNFECNRGKPRKYFSDNGTNFHGAHNVFCEELANLDHDKIQEEFVTSETSWSFNPPKGAHMGGVWERMVGIVKTCLDEVLTIRYPTDEMLKSLFAEVMNIVNSRPLTYVSLESPDDEVLTPNHFLLGSSNGHKPPGTFVDADLVRNNWRTIQAMSDKFWHKFVDQYLPMLVKRPKWFRKVEPMQVGDVVLLVDSSFQRNTWPKGIIIETFKDKTCVFVQSNNGSKGEGSLLFYYLGIDYLYSAIQTLIFSFISLSTLMLGILVYFQLFMVATCLTNNEKHADSIKDQLSRYTTLRFLLKPMCFGAGAWAQCFIFVHLFDQAYENLFVAKELSDGVTVTYVKENLLVLRLAAFFTGVEFFIDNFISGGFRLQYPSTRVGWSISSVIRVGELLQNIKGSICIAIGVWVASLLLGSVLYSPLFIAAGVHLFQPQVLERVLMFLDIKFMIRLLLWVYIPRLTLRLYLSLVNSSFTEIINFPIECPPGNTKCLTLSDAMKSDNPYIKCQAFYEFKLKTRLGNPDLIVFFNITHPGNHPLNWKGVFTSSTKVLSDGNENMVNFLRDAKLPSNILQAGFQPYVLSKLRRKPPPSTSTASSEIAGENSKAKTKRDLTSLNNPIPQDGPTVYDLVKQIPNALWNDLRDACKGLVTMQNINNIIFLGKFETTTPEKQISNFLCQGTLSFWALEGTLELICLSVTHDPHGIVHQDLQEVFKIVVETHDILSVMDFYVINTLDRDDVNRKIFEEIKGVIGKLLSATIFVLAKLNASFSHCYRILNVDETCEQRIQDIIAAKNLC